ncbi:MAG: hypothetical protein MN733_27240 [Nitrososphaera sp.]|nr:hypothetical protein [Nitrososphaera sp.]
MLRSSPQKLKSVPAGINLLLVLFSHVVQPVLLVQELLATIAALDNASFMSILGVLDKLVVAPESSVAILAFCPFPVQQAHGMVILKGGYKLLDKKKRLAPCQRLRLVAEKIT